MARPEEKGSSCLVPILIALSIAAAVAGLLVWRWAHGRVGSDCDEDADCNAQRCLHVGLGGGGQGVCTDHCTADGDCPSDMRCGTASRPRFHEPAYGTPQIHVCTPTGERLDELLR